MNDCHPPRKSNELRAREICNSVLLERLDEFSNLRDLNVGIITYNVASILPSHDICHQLLAFEQPLDVVAVALQEVDHTPWTMTMETSDNGALWIAHVSGTLKKFGHYCKVYEQQLVGLVLVVFVQQGLQPHVHRLQATHFRSGMFWYTTPKGGIVLRFTLLGRRFLFCAQHLTPHPEGLAERLAEHELSMTTSRLPLPLWADDPVDLFIPCHYHIRSNLQPPDLIESSPTSPSSSAPAVHSSPQAMDSSYADYCFWFGDLNYRVTVDYATAIQFLKAADLPALLQHDQLSIVRQQGRGYGGFREAPITFPPSYKFDKGTALYDTSPKQRTPSWTDRILWACPAMDADERRPATGPAGAPWKPPPAQKGCVSPPCISEGVPGFLEQEAPEKAVELLMEQNLYELLPHVTASDHRPVRALFTARCRLVDPDRLDAVLALVQREAMAPDGSALLPLLSSDHFLAARLGDLNAECLNCTVL